MSRSFVKSTIQVPFRVFSTDNSKLGTTVWKGLSPALYKITPHASIDNSSSKVGTSRTTPAIIKSVFGLMNSVVFQKESSTSVQNDEVPFNSLSFFRKI